MEVSITRFRHNIATLLDHVADGNELWVAYKDRRFKIVPERLPASRLSRLTSLEVINPEWPELDQTSLCQEMRLAWEKDWSTL